MSKNKIVDLFAHFGMMLNDGDEAHNILDVDQHVFQSNLRSHLTQQQQQSKKDGEANASASERLLANIVSYLNVEMNLLVGLLPTRTNTELVASHSSNQDSLVKILIEIEPLQARLFDYLIAKIKQYATSSSSDADAAAVVSSDVNVLGLDVNVPIYIINQFRYQPRIAEPNALCKKLVALIKTISSSVVKREIIVCFPDILSDSERHDSIAGDLEALLCGGNADLVATTLDTLANLKFEDTSTTTRLVARIYDTYESFGECDVHAIVKFVLKSAAWLRSTPLLMRLRDHLCLERMRNEPHVLLAFDVLREYFQVSSQLVELYMTGMSELVASKDGNFLNVYTSVSCRISHSVE